MMYRYKIYVDGLYVCGVDGNDKEHVISSILHYARQYAKEGVVSIEGDNRKKVTPRELVNLLKSKQKESK